MLWDVQKVDRDETSASLLSLFSENQDNLFQGLWLQYIWDLISSLDPKSKAQSIAWKQVTSPPPRKTPVRPARSIDSTRKA